MKKIIFIITVCVSLSGLIVAAVSAAEKSKVRGWRGDGTGRFPDAEPPVKWGQISKTLKGLRIQTDRPKGDGHGTGEPLSAGAIEDWLALGPVDAKGKNKDLVDKELLPGEASFRPNAGEKVGELTWQKVKGVGALLHLNSFYKDLKDKAVYICTYIYSPGPCTVKMWMKTGFCKIWINGSVFFNKPLRKDGRWIARPDLQLQKGWNCLLVKILAAKNAGPAYGNAPAGTAYFRLKLFGMSKDETYETRNILWIAHPPQAGRFSCYQPVVAGDKVFIVSDPRFLICYDKKTGKKLWMRDIWFGDFVTKEEREKNGDLFKEIDPKEKRFKELAYGYKGAPSDRDEMSKLNKELKKLYRKVDGKRYTLGRDLQEPGATSQPVTDGKYVYTWFFNGIAACHDLNGKRIWATLENEGGHKKHGYLLAPILLRNELVVGMLENVIAFDRKSGKIKWRIPYRSNTKYSWYGIYDGTKTMKSKDCDWINYAKMGLYKKDEGFFPWSTVTVGGDCFYKIRNGISCYNLPKRVENLTKRKFESPGRDAFPAIPGGSAYGRHPYIGNVLVHNGLIYCISLSGNVAVLDEKDGGVVYIRRTPLQPITHAYPYPYGSGVCASPTLGGKYIYFWGANGKTLVIKPGRKYEVVAVNRIERLLKGGHYGSRRRTDLAGMYPECTVSSPIFDGKHIYYRAEEYLYCIGGQ